MITNDDHEMMMIISRKSLKRAILSSFSLSFLPDNDDDLTTLLVSVVVKREESCFIHYVRHSTLSLSSCFFKQSNKK